MQLCKCKKKKKINKIKKLSFNNKKLCLLHQQVVKKCENSMTFNSMDRIASEIKRDNENEIYNVITIAIVADC